jgi:exopolysaccharide biosynthesis polyprenyl glycosylphosphotransferase
MLATTQSWPVPKAPAMSSPVANIQPKIKKRPSADWIVFLVMAGDTVAVTVAIAWAIVNRQYNDFGFLNEGVIPIVYLRNIWIGTLLYLGLLQLFGVYKKHIILDKFQTISLTLKASAAWAAALLICTLVPEWEPLIPRVFLIWGFVNSLVLVCLWRLAFRRLLFEKTWAGLLKQKVLVIGWSKESQALANQIRRQYAHPYEIIGCTPSAHAKFWVTPPKEVPVLGDYNSAAEVLASHRPDVVILADLDPVMGEIISLAELCEREHVKFKVIPSYFQIFTSGLSLENVSGVPIMGVTTLPLDYVHNRVIKRTVDIVGAIVGLILSVPIITIFGILVYRESPGPIFFKQKRMGRQGQLFEICKIRSMRLDAEKNGAQRAVANDQRRLAIGSVMRKWNVDEVPQFWNVLKGDMSLVGPRPEILGLIPELKTQIRHYGARHNVKAGMTGWAQINGFRGDTDLNERIRFDLYYVEKWSLWLDLYIMAKTCVSQSNAY